MEELKRETRRVQLKNYEDSVIKEAKASYCSFPHISHIGSKTYRHIIFLNLNHSQQNEKKLQIE